MSETVGLPTEMDGRYVLRLYVTGMRPRSAAAIAAIRAICEQPPPRRRMIGDLSNRARVLAGLDLQLRE